MTVPTPFVPGSEFAGVVTEVADDVDAVAVGDRVAGTTLVGAFAEEVVVAADAVRRIPDGVDIRLAAAFGVAHRTAYHVLRSVAARAARRRAGRARRGRRRRPGRRAARRPARRHGDRRGVVGREARGGQGAGRHPPGRPPHRPSCGPPCASCCPRGPTWSSTPSAATCPSRRCGRCGGAGGSSPSASRPARSPASRSTWCCSRASGCWASSSATSWPTPPDEFARNEDELTDLLASGRVVPHIGASFGLEDAAAALALRRRRPGDRQGRHRRRPRRAGESPHPPMLG